MLDKKARLKLLGERHEARARERLLRALEPLDKDADEPSYDARHESWRELPGRLEW